MLRDTTDDSKNNVSYSRACLRQGPRSAPSTIQLRGNELKLSQQRQLFCTRGLGEDGLHQIRFCTMLVDEVIIIKTWTLNQSDLLEINFSWRQQTLRGLSGHGRQIKLASPPPLKSGPTDPCGWICAGLFKLLRQTEAKCAPATFLSWHYPVIFSRILWHDGSCKDYTCPC